jgi:hypothetical protein
VFEVVCKGRNSKGLIELSRKDLLPRARRRGRGQQAASGDESGSSSWSEGRGSSSEGSPEAL